MTCEMWELKKCPPLNLDSDRRKLSIWSLYNMTHGFTNNVFTLQLIVLNYFFRFSFCPRLSRVRDTFTSSFHMIDYPPGWPLSQAIFMQMCKSSFPDSKLDQWVAWAVHLQGVSFSFSESPDLQGVLLLLPSHFQLQMISHPLQDAKLSASTQWMSFMDKRKNSIIGNVIS